MSRRALILAVVVLLIASSLAVLGTSQARAAAPSSSPGIGSPHPAVSEIYLYTGSGSCTYCNLSTYASGGSTDYGPGANILYFFGYDYAGDHSVNFTLTDPNASRDDVGQPAWTVNTLVNQTTDQFNSVILGLSFTFPSSLKVGGGWNVSVSAPLGGNASYPIWVSTYYVDYWGAPEPGSIVLPGETVTTAYETYSDVNGAPESDITNVSYNGHYTGANDSYLNLFASGSVTQPATAFGSYTWTVPANATFDTYVEVNVWVSIYVGTQQAENESYGIDYQVGTLYIDSFTMESNEGQICPNYYDNYYDSGSLVQACAIVGAFGGEDQFTPVAGLTVAIAFWDGVTHVTPPGDAPASLVSNSSGEVTFSFLANTTQFSSYYQYPFYNAVNLTVTNPGATPSGPPFAEVWDNATFYMEASAASAGITVSLNQLAYFPGQTITATWTVASTNSEQTGPIYANSWYLVSDDYTYLGQGTISSTATTGTLPIVLPSGYTGAFTLYVDASNATTYFEGEVGGVVQPATLTLTPSSPTFTAGSTVTILAQAWGDGSLAAPMISYQIYAGYEQGYSGYGGYGLVSSGTVTNDSSITISVPSSGAPSYYEIYAYLGSATAGTVASAYLEVEQSWGYNVIVGVTTLSSYSDGSYQPGQTITVSYQIAPYGGAAVPVLYEFSISLYSTQLGSIISTTSSSGTVQVTIPSYFQTGFAILEVELRGTYLSGNACSTYDNGQGECYGETGIAINAHPSVLSMDLGAGSGLTVGWLVLLIIVLVIAVVLVLLIRRKRSMPPSGGAPPMTTPMSPPAPAPSSPGATEWVNPSSDPSAGGSQPPMPSPPPGAT